MRILIEYIEHKAQFADIKVLLDYAHEKREKIENKLDEIISNII